MATYTLETITAAQALAFSASDVLVVSNPSATALQSYATPAAGWTATPLSPGAAVLILTPGLSNNVQFGSGMLGKTIVFQDGTRLYVGSPGADQFTGSALSDKMSGGDGADILTGAAGDDYLDGGDGDNFFEGGPGNDTMGGGATGIDTVTYANAPGSVSIDLAHGITSGAAGVDYLVNIENLVGGAANDTLVGNDFSNNLQGGAGDDQLQGWSDYNNDRDTLSGEDGNDNLHNASLITGGAGNDTITMAYSTSSDVRYGYGGVGNDDIWSGQGGFVFGEDGNDSLSSSRGGATLDGAAGNDSIIAGGGGNTVIGGAGADTIGDAGSLYMGGDNLLGGAGNDSITVNGGGDTVSGGDGDDVIRVDRSLSSQSYVQLGASYDVSGGAGSDTFIGGPSGVIRILDWETGDRLSLGNAPATSYAEVTKSTADEALQFAKGQIAAGVNYIAVAVGSDVLVFADTYNANAADSTNMATIVGRTLNDISVSNIVGGSTPDPAPPSPPGPPAPPVTPPSSGVAQGTISGNMDAQHLSSLLGASIDTRSTSLTLNNGSVTAKLIGSGFTYDVYDQLTGGSISNLQYNSPSFTLNLNTTGLSASSFANWVYYDQTQVAFSTILAGNDLLTGGAGADLIRGYGGNDSLSGAGGNDTLAGGAGADVFNGFAGADRILDFNAAEGDQLALSAGTTYTIAQSGADTVVSLSGGAQVILANIASSLLTGAWITGGTSSGGGGVASGSTFGSLTPAAALGITAADNLTIGAGTAVGVTVVYNLDGTIALSLNGQSMTFGSAISDVSKAGHISMPDGSKLFIGLGGADSFMGAATGDAEFGGQGDDSLDGGLGSDLLQGNQGADSLVGGEGNDTVYGGQDGDNLQMGQGGNFGQGNRGEDVITAGEGIDTLLGGQDNDTVSGGGGNDFLNGNRGDDSINGGDGADTLYGEGGSDTLTGGLGADIFHGFADGGLDRILDFSRADGDRIVLDAGTVYTASQSGGDVVVAYGTNQIVIVGVTMASLTGDWITVG